ncbi:MAG TPA: hypothetical protein IGS53_13680 [Leptolyngbyaceae cyanobacterium M33_DOE_097]|nr:hypothetical protein [Leptolyngbyaceae cyanobacterium M33_DOE_097]
MTELLVIGHSFSLPGKVGLADHQPPEHQADKTKIEFRCRMFQYSSSIGMFHNPTHY